MDNKRKAAPTGMATGQDGKKAWSTPALARLEANNAEVGTRLADDGTFTTS